MYFRAPTAPVAARKRAKSQTKRELAGDGPESLLTVRSTRLGVDY